MQSKKNPKLNLEQYRFLFFQVGLVCTLAFIIGVISFTTESEANLDIPSELVDHESELFDISATFRKPRQEKQLVVKSIPTPNPNPIPDSDPKPCKRKKIIIPTGNFIDDPNGTELGEPIEKAEPIPLVLAEKYPVFYGCDANMTNEELKECFNYQIRKWVMDNVNYPTLARSMGIQGKVHVKFVIDVDGFVSDVEVVRSVDPLLDAEAVRVIKTIRPMEAGKHRGLSVPIMMTVPINFRVQ